MKHPNAKQLLQEAADRYGLRFLERSGHYLGIRNGLCIDASEFKGTLRFYAFSPTALLGADAVLESFQGFSHLAEASIPTDWLEGRVLSDGKLDKHGCVLELSRDRLASLAPETVVEIPELLALDFQRYQTTAEPAVCSRCGAAAPTELMYLAGAYHISCRECLEKLKVESPKGDIPVEAPIQGGRVAATLAIGSLAFVVIWGFLQQPSDHGLDMRLILAAPFFGSIFFCRMVARAANGMTLPLRMLTIACITISILAGNIWGYRSVLLQQVEVTWQQAISLYFTECLPADGSQEGLYLIGGLAGAWLGFGMLRWRSVAKFE